MNAQLNVDECKAVHPHRGHGDDHGSEPGFSLSVRFLSARAILAAQN